MAGKQYTSDDLETPLMKEPLSRKDLVRLLRSALEKNPGETIERTIRLLMQVTLEDAGYGSHLRAELAQELLIATPLELSLMRDTLLAARTPRTPEVNPTSSTPTSDSGSEAPK